MSRLTMFRIMSQEQQNLLSLVKTSAQVHLDIILANPEVYLGTFRYGVDFVWGMPSLYIFMLFFPPLNIFHPLPSLALLT
jgi:hypothetical protein